MSRPKSFVSVYGLSRKAERFYAKRAKEGIVPTVEAMAALKADEKQRGILRKMGKPERRLRVASPRSKPRPKVAPDNTPSVQAVVAARERRLIQAVYSLPVRPLRIGWEECMFRKAVTG